MKDEHISENINQLVFDLDNGYDSSKKKTDKFFEDLERSKGYTVEEIMGVFLNCCEQYRREKMKELFPRINRDLLNALDIGEMHLHLEGTLEERLEQVIDTYTK